MSKKDKAENVKKLSEADATKAILEFLRRERRGDRSMLTQVCRETDLIVLK